MNIVNQEQSNLRFTTPTQGTIISILSALFFAGCAVKNEGASDYAKMSIEHAQSQQVASEITESLRNKVLVGEIGSNRVVSSVVSSLSIASHYDEEKRATVRLSIDEALKSLTNLSQLQTVEFQESLRLALAKRANSEDEPHFTGAEIAQIVMEVSRELNNRSQLAGERLGNSASDANVNRDDTGLNDEVPMMLSSRLIHKYDMRNDLTVIEEDDSLAVRLLRGYIKTFPEFMSGDDVALWASTDIDGRFVTSGEVAIVVNAFEHGFEGGNFAYGPGADEKGRLVYYSNDVQKGQPYNFSNLPVYGPITYTGRPFGLQIHVIELDVDSAQTNALLHSLAGIGKVAFAPSSPVLDVLESLGKSMLSSPQNDVHLRYDLMFDPKGTDPKINYPRLEEGIYAVVRLEDRNEGVPWEMICLQKNTGMLGRMKGGSLKSCKAPYREHSWLTFAIRSGLEAKELDLQENTLTDLIARLEVQDQARAGVISSIGRDFEKSQRSIIVKDRIRNRLSRVKSSKFDSVERRKRAYELLSELIACNEAIKKSPGSSLDRNEKICAVADASGTYLPLLTDDELGTYLDKVRQLVPDKNANLDVFNLLERDAFPPSTLPTKKGVATRFEELLDAIWKSDASSSN